MTRGNRRAPAVGDAAGAAIMGDVKVLLRNPRREVELRGPLSVAALLNRFSLNRDAVLIVRNGTLVPGDDVLDDSDTVEIRPVISGGALETLGTPAQRPPRRTADGAGRTAGSAKGGRR